MTPTALALRGLRYYWRTNLAVDRRRGDRRVGAGGRACRRLVGEGEPARAGGCPARQHGSSRRIDRASSARRWPARSRRGRAFRPRAFIALDGLAADGTNTRRAANVAIYGVDDTFFAFHGVPAPAGDEGAFGGRQALVSPALARDLGVAAGDSVLARLPSPSVVPSATLHGRRDALGKTMRATVRAVLPESGLGGFALRPNQGEVRAIYLPLARVQREFERPDRVNAIVVAGDATPDVRSNRDDACRRRSLAAEPRTIGGASRSRATAASSAPGPPPRPGGHRAAGVIDAGFAYLAHTLRVGAREIPYAVVAGIELDRLDLAGAGASGPIKDDRIWLNAWAAEGLGQGRRHRDAQLRRLGRRRRHDLARDDADRRRHPADVRRRRGSDADTGVPGHLGQATSPTGIHRFQWT